MEGPLLADIRLCGAFPGPLGCHTPTVQARNTHDRLNVRVAWCGDKFIGELLRDGITQPVRSLCRFLLSERAARTLGTASTRDDTRVEDHSSTNEPAHHEHDRRKSTDTPHIV
jgi:hypothetical protein